MRAQCSEVVDAEIWSTRLGRYVESAWYRACVERNCGESVTVEQFASASVSCPPVVQTAPALPAAYTTAMAIGKTHPGTGLV